MCTPSNPVEFAVAKCPFLAELARKHGTEYASRIAIDPTRPAHTLSRRPVLEEAVDLERTFSLFHGPVGCFPLTSSAVQTDVTEKPAGGRVHAVPLASLSLSGPSFGDEFFKRHFGKRNKQQPKQQPAQRKPDPPAARGQFRGTGPSTPSGPSSSPSGLRGSGVGGTPGGPVRGPKPPAAGSSGVSHPTARGNLTGGGAPAGGGAGGGRAARVPGGGAAGAQPGASSKCPLRSWLGPLAGVVFNRFDRIACPEPVIQMRAALARTAPVRSLRPQSLPVKLAAVGLMSLAVNLPAGAVREHFDKFSLGWFVAVHVTVPFVAMLRKAVVLPKFALAVTLASAIAGQLAGSRMMRRQLAAAAAPAAPAGAASSVRAPRAAVAAGGVAAGLPASVAGAPRGALGMALAPHASLSAAQRAASRVAHTPLAALSLGQCGALGACTMPGGWLMGPTLVDVGAQ